uniref:Uncharacterized protein n=1 Tax=Paramormyrops kingsleyae TaxID=1676925 RepID=A0A3B3QEG0_9TELE
MNYSNNGQLREIFPDKTANSHGHDTWHGVQGLTRVLLDERVNMDASARAASVHHYPVKHTAAVGWPGAVWQDILPLCRKINIKKISFNKNGSIQSPDHQYKKLQEGLQVHAEIFVPFPLLWSVPEKKRVRLEGVCASAETPSHRALGHVTDTSSSSINTQMSAPELPGFYFDAEKNRYFRLLPGHNNCNPLTREGLQREEQERRRLRLLEEEAASVGTVSTPSQCAALCGQVSVSPALDFMSICIRPVHYDIGNSWTHFYGRSAGQKQRTGIFLFSRSHLGSASTLRCSCRNGTWGLFQETRTADQPGMLCSFKISTAWSCAWCLNPQADKNFSTGLSRRVIVTDAVTGRRQTYGVGSDVLAQQFALRAPILYNGGRSGEIFSIDLRQRARRGHGWKACRFYQESAITSVHVLQDENYLVAADMKGTIKLWDVRVTKAVRQYDGHHNEHAYLPLHVCEPEGLLLAVGQDCYTRLWSLGDGRLLRTIPSPHPASKDSVPSVVFSSQLGGRRGLPGLLMAVRHDLYHFPYSCDYGDGNALSKGC